MAEFLGRAGDFLMDCLMSGILFFLIASLYAFVRSDKFGEALGTAMLGLFLAVVVPMITDAFLHTRFSTILPWGKAPTLIGAFLVMPGMGLLFGIMRSW